MKHIGERIAKIEHKDVEASSPWPGLIFFVLVVIAALGAVAYILRLQETTPPEPTGLEARSIAPPSTVKGKGYIVDIGPLIVRSREPGNASAAVYITTKGPKPAQLNCVLKDANGIPMGGGVVGGIDLAFGAEMAVSGPLLRDGRLRCNVVDRTPAPTAASH